MTIADKLTLLANTKEALRAKLKLDKGVPFSKYPDYVNWQNVPSIPNKAFYADFTNDRYVKDGVPCNFIDLFTFNRAGKAWLVKDTGLQEYAADVPRFDDGLLIEQSATNYYADSLLTNTTSTSDGIYLEPYGIKLPKNTGSSLSMGSQGLDSATITTSCYIESEIEPIPHPLTGRMFYLQVGGLTAATEVIPDVKLWLATNTNSTRTRGRFGVMRSSTYDLNYDLNFKYYQIEQGGKVTSHIKTTGVNVTRPADFLLSKIAGTTVTGDWDSTLNLSIVNGNLVHSGYGRIRSLEIN